MKDQEKQTRNNDVHAKEGANETKRKKDGAESCESRRHSVHSLLFEGSMVSEVAVVVFIDTMKEMENGIQPLTKC